MSARRAGAVFVRRYVGTCLRCGRTESISARGLCTADYSLGESQGWLDEYPRKNRQLNDFADDFRVLKDRGLNNGQIASHMGYSPASISKLIARARKAGLVAGGRRWSA